MAPPKGTTNNPRGRPPRGKSLTETLTRVLNQKGPDGVVNRDAVAIRLVEMAKEGHMGAIREIYNRIEGKIPDVVHTAELPKIVIVDETGPATED